MGNGYINKSDFVGEIKISQNTKEVNTLQYYIDRYFNNILEDLIGDFQLSIFNSTLDNTTNKSTVSKYKVLITGKNYLTDYDESTATQFYYYDKDKIYTNYYGVLESFKYFIYWYFVRDLRAKVTSVGVKFPDSENSVNPSQNEINAVIEQRYNEAVEMYQKAYRFLENVYDCKVHYNQMIDNGDDTYTIKLIQENKNSLNLAQLIDAGDFIELDKKDYQVLSNDFTTVPTESMITFEETSGKTFEDEFFYIEPYKEYRSKRKHLSVLDGFL
jgi:hypothetical protein